jgi:L-aminopeptidase/D-esterase-like protein
MAITSALVMGALGLAVWEGPVRPGPVWAGPGDGSGAGAAGFTGGSGAAPGAAMPGAAAAAANSPSNARAMNLERWLGMLESYLQIGAKQAARRPRRVQVRGFRGMLEDSRELSP